MSRAKEVQEKLNLQAQLQGSFAESKGKVLSWLRNDFEQNDAQAGELRDSKTAFFELPVVQTGSGLNLTSVQGLTGDQEDIHTVGEFIKSEKKVNSLSKKKQRSQQNTQTNSIYSITKNDTKAMVALKRKMRKTQQQGLREQLQPGKPTGAAISKTHSRDSYNEDSDDEPRIEKTKKKEFGLLFNKHKKSRK